MRQPFDFHTDYQYTDRETKAKYVWLKYQSILKGHILDVGADQCYLKQYLPEDTDYWGIGLGGDLDQQVDLENEKIPFPDNSFDCVLCLDVLEHLENIHDVFDELCRVSRLFLIISLPNAWSDFYHVLRFGNYRPNQPMKFYCPRSRQGTDTNGSFPMKRVRSSSFTGQPRMGCEYYKWIIPVSAGK
jgi:hypothetical protein